MVALIPPLIPALRRQISGSLRSLGYIESSGCIERRCLTEKRIETGKRGKEVGGGKKKKQASSGHRALPSLWWCLCADNALFCHIFKKERNICLTYLKALYIKNKNKFSFSI